MKHVKFKLWYVYSPFLAYTRLKQWLLRNISSTNTVMVVVVLSTAQGDYVSACGSADSRGDHAQC